MRRAVLIAVALAPWALACAESLLPAATDLQQLAAESARLKAPIVLLFSTPGCPYCREVRRNYLVPRSADLAPTSRLLLREIDVTSSGRLVDFEGRATTQARFAAASESRSYRSSSRSTGAVSRSASRWSGSTAPVSTRLTCRN